MKGPSAIVGMILALGVVGSSLAESQDLAPFVPPPCVPGEEMFTDVPASNPFCPWIEQLVRDHVTGGCGPMLYCPTAAVTRAQMAVFLELAMRGTDTWIVNADLLDGMNSTEFVDGVSAGPGLTGGGSGGNVTVGLATTYQLPQSCAPGQHPAWSGSGWGCGTPGNGTVTSVGTGAGLTGGPITTSGTVSVAIGGITSAMIADGTIGSADVSSTDIQLRVGGTCAAGSSIRVVNAAGSVTCEPDDVGTYAAGTGLILTGNTFSADFGVVAPRLHNHLGETWAASSVNPALIVRNAGGGPVLRVEKTNGLYAIEALANDSTGVSRAVHGRDASTGGVGVEGFATAATGTPRGVFGGSNATQGRGVEGEAFNLTGQTYGVLGTSHSTEGTGGAFEATATTGFTYGVMGTAGADRGTGVLGKATATSGLSYGVYGRSESSSGYAGYFWGNVHVTGNLSVGGTKSFKIDHPLDPANRYLVHSAIESSEMLNLYSGTAVLDGAGTATVELPGWFEAVNRDFRYQLTCVGGYAPVYVSSEIQQGRFGIAGGRAGLRVSWLVVGTRSDAYALAHPMPVEQDKPAEERGTYMHPVEHGQPVELGRDHRLMHRVRAE